jgi:hypothetical protein
VSTPDESSTLPESTGLPLPPTPLPAAPPEPPVSTPPVELLAPPAPVPPVAAVELLVVAPLAAVLLEAVGPPVEGVVSFVALHAHAATPMKAAIVARSARVRVTR